MASKNITNTTDSPLVLANGVTIGPRATVQIERWDDVKNHDVTKAWLDAGLLSFDEADAKDEPDADAVNGTSSKGAGAGESPLSDVNKAKATNNVDDDLGRSAGGSPTTGAPANPFGGAKAKK